MKDVMNSSRHIIASIFFWFLIVIAGTIGYMVIEGWNLLDSFYMTVITYSTVGYGEVHNISKAGEIYTMFLIFLGVGFYLYVASAIIQFMVEGKIRLIMGRRKLDWKIKFKAAGADFVESPYEMGAIRMAQRIIRPSVTSFFDQAFTSKSKDIQMEEIPVSASSPLNNVMLKDSGIRQNYDLIIIAIKTSDDAMMFNPSFETWIKAGETVLAVGDPKI